MSRWTAHVEMVNETIQGGYYVSHDDLRSAPALVRGLEGAKALRDPALVIDVDVGRNTEGFLLDAGSFRLQAPAKAADALSGYVGRSVSFGVRPSDIFGKDNLPPSLTATGGNTIKALCEVTEPMGDRMHLYLSAAPHSFIADVDAETGVQEEQEVELVLDLNRSHAFDKKTEQALY